MSDETDAPADESTDRFETIAVLDSEVESQLVDAVLTDRKIPHLLVSYYDSAYGGIFQGASGWGRVEAPARCRDEIEALLEEIKRQSPELPDDAGSESEEPTPGTP